MNKIIERPQEFKICMPKDYRTDTILRNKLLIGCKGIEQYRLARQKVSSAVEGVMADLSHLYFTNLNKETHLQST